MTCNSFQFYRLQLTFNVQTVLSMKEEWRKRNWGVKCVEMLSLPLAIDWFLFSPLDVSAVERRVVFRYVLGGAALGLQTTVTTDVP